nr:unnamed protein product [Callosobruchus analis]
MGLLYFQRLLLWCVVLSVLALRGTRGCQNDCHQDNCCGNCRSSCTTATCVQSCCSSCCCKPSPPASTTPCPPPLPPQPTTPSNSNVNNDINSTLDVTINNHINVENRVYVPISINNSNVQSVSIVDEDNITSIPYDFYNRYPVPIPGPYPVSSGCCTVIRPCVYNGCQSYRQHCGSGCLGSVMYEPINPCHYGCYRRPSGYRQICSEQNSCVNTQVDCSGCSNDFYETYGGFQKCGGCFSGMPLNGLGAFSGGGLEGYEAPSTKQNLELLQSSQNTFKNGFESQNKDQRCLKFQRLTLFTEENHSKDVHIDIQRTILSIWRCFSLELSEVLGTSA